NKEDRAEQRQQRRPRAPGDLFLQRLDGYAPPLVRVGELLRKPAGDQVQISSGLFERDARFQPSDGVAEVRAALGLWRHFDGAPQVYGLAMWHRAVITADVLHARRRHADDRERPPR